MLIQKSLRIFGLLNSFKKDVVEMYYENKIGKIYFEVHGPKEAPAIIFSHGVNMNHQTFQGQVADLRDKFQVIIWDLPYHGKSSAINNQLSFSDTSADFISELLKHLKIDKATLCGLSLGSYVTQIAAFKYPEQIQASIHIGGGPLHPPVGKFLKIFNPLVGLFINLYPQRRLFKDFARKRTFDNDTRVYLERIAAENGKGVMTHLTKELLRDMSRGLSAFSTEAKLLIHGVDELAFVQRLMKRWHQKDSTTTLKAIQNAHHIANQDNPQQVNQVISNFMEDILKK